MVALLYAGGAWNACGGSPADGEGMCRCVCSFVFLLVLVVSESGGEGRNSRMMRHIYECAYRGTYAPGRGGVGALKVLPIFVFAYTCHQVSRLVL